MKSNRIRKSSGLIVATLLGPGRKMGKPRRGERKAKTEKTRERGKENQKDHVFVLWGIV